MDYRKFIKSVTEAYPTIKSTEAVEYTNTSVVNPVTSVPDAVDVVANPTTEEVEVNEADIEEVDIEEVEIDDVLDNDTPDNEDSNNNEDDQFDEVSSIDAASIADKMIADNNNSWDAMYNSDVDRNIELAAGSTFNATNLVPGASIDNASGEVVTTPFQSKVMDMLSNLSEAIANINMDNGKYGLTNEEIMDSDKVTEYLRYMYNEYEDNYLDDLPMTTDLNPGMYNMIANIHPGMQKLITWCSDNVAPVLNPLFLLYPFFIESEDTNAYFKFLSVYHKIIESSYMDLIELRAKEFDKSMKTADVEYLERD